MHQTAIQDALEIQTQAAFEQAADSFKRVLKDRDPLVSVDEVLDATVSIDGTWVKRGFSSLVGTVVCVLKETGQVIDAVVLSRTFPECKIWEAREHNEAYVAWKARHETRCQCNFAGSAPAMEAEGISIIFAHSVQQFGLRREVQQQNVSCCKGGKRCKTQ